MEPPTYVQESSQKRQRLSYYTPESSTNSSLRLRPTRTCSDLPEEPLGHYGQSRSISQSGQPRFPHASPSPLERLLSQQKFNPHTKSYQPVPSRTDPSPPASLPPSPGSVAKMARKFLFLSTVTDHEMALFSPLTATTEIAKGQNASRIRLLDEGSSPTSPGSSVDSGQDDEDEPLDCLLQDKNSTGMQSLPRSASEKIPVNVPNGRDEPGSTTAPGQEKAAVPFFLYKDDMITGDLEFDLDINPEERSEPF